MQETHEYVNDFSRPARPRNFIICLDGTWNDQTGKDGDSVITNVSKLYKSLEVDSDAQISRYFRGIGNDEEYSRLGTLVTGLTGADEKRIRHDAYSMIVKEYRNGDRIYIFGFSRGAACARMLASQLHKEMIPEKIRITTEARENHVTKYVENRFVEFEVPDNVKRQPVEVTFLGVWDTVYAFGISVKLLGIPFHRWDLFSDKHVAPNILRAVHLVSIDETRNPFEPTLMNHLPGVVHEVWFPGVHSDVGGGYAEDMLGRITFKYMLDKLADYTRQNNLPPIVFHQPTLDKYLPSPTGEFQFHFHGLGYKKSLREIHVLENDKRSGRKPLINESVFQLQQSTDVYSVVENKKEKRKYPIQYNPSNLKQLHGNYEVDK